MSSQRVKLASLRAGKSSVAFRERRPGVIQVLAPLFHEDGGMLDIFLDEARNGTSKLRVSDRGYRS